MSDSLEATRAVWDAEAAAFDDEPDHGLRDPAVRAAWRSMLIEHLPAAPARVADLGCGSGSLSVLLAQAGYDVSGIDLSDEMLVRARAKASAAGVDVSFAQGDASDPALEPAAFDVVLCREHREDVTLRLLPEAVYWGKDVDDERYVVVSRH